MADTKTLPSKSVIRRESSDWCLFIAATLCIVSAISSFGVINYLQFNEIWSLKLRVKQLETSCGLIKVRCLTVYHQENMSVQRIPPYTPLLYSKTGVCRDIPIFVIFAPKHRLWVLVRTASLWRFLRESTIYVLSKNKKKYYKCSSIKIVQILQLKKSLYFAWARFRNAYPF